MASPTELNQIGIQFAQARQFVQAAEYFRQAVAANPLSPNSHINLANVLAELGDYAGAKASYGRALALAPHSVDLHFNYAVMLTRLEDHAAAAESYQHVVQLAPNHAPAHSKLGVALARLQRHAEGIGALQRALALAPNEPEVHANLGTALAHADQYEQAFQSYERALALRPNHLDARCNYGVALMEYGRLAESQAQFEAALAIYPECVDAHMSRAVVRLMQGDFANGFAEYEWRLREKALVRFQHAATLWDGSPLPGKTLVLEAEQGLGDTIQFVRYAREIKRLHPGSRIILAVERALQALLKDVEGADAVIAQPEARPAFDYWAPLLSLPRILRDGASTFPAAVPYLRAEPQRVARWRERLAGVPGIRVGISWQGSKLNRSDRRRSFPLPALAPLAATQGISLVSLQKGVSADELRSLANFPVVHLGDDFDAAGGAFLDTVAVMRNLDLVVSADTSIGHVAGATATPVWLALAHVADWRWLTQGESTVWYPTMRLFRQSVRGDWSGVFQRMAAELASAASSAKRENAN